MGEIINDLIVRCVSETGATTLTITHDMQSAHKIADRIAMIFQGRIIWIGGTDEISDSGNEYVDQFIQGRTNGPIQMAAQLMARVKTSSCAKTAGPAIRNGRDNVTAAAPGIPWAKNRQRIALPKA